MLLSILAEDLSTHINASSCWTFANSLAFSRSIRSNTCPIGCDLSVKAPDLSEASRAYLIAPSGPPISILYSLARLSPGRRSQLFLQGRNFFVYFRNVVLRLLISSSASSGFLRHSSTFSFSRSQHVFRRTLFSIPEDQTIAPWRWSSRSFINSFSCKIVFISLSLPYHLSSGQYQPPVTWAGSSSRPHLKIPGLPANEYPVVRVFAPGAANHSPGSEERHHLGS